ncbi:MAG: hypothetical protein WA021_04550, partial [Minisyncoccia bacterium]
MKTLTLTSLSACILFTIFATPANAQTAAELEASAAIETSITPPPMQKPLDALKARAQQLKQNAGAQMEMKLKGPGPNGTTTMRAEAKMQMRDDKKMASTTRPGFPGAGIKALFKMHGGL